MISSKVFLFFFIFLIGLVASAKNPAGYSVNQSGNLVFVRTPWGSSVYLAPVGFDAIRSFSFEIPLSEFRNSVSSGSPSPSTANGTSSSSSLAMGDVGGLIAEANRLYNDGDFSGSLKYVDEASRREPNNVRLWVMKGSLMHVLGHTDLAKQAWTKALELDPKNTQLANVLKEIK